MFDRFKQVANATKFKADQMLRVQGVQNEIATINQQVSGVKDRIADLVLELHKQGPLGIPELDELVGSVDGLLAQIAQKKAQIAAINAEAGPQAAPPPPQPGYAPPQPQAAAATKVCPNCHNVIPAAAMFCTTCGYSFQAAPPAAAAPKATQTCPNCQFEAPAASAFCPNCGHALAH